MPKYLSDHDLYDPITKADRPVQLLLECPHPVIDHLPIEILANIANDMPEKAFTITVKLLEAGEKPIGRKRKT